MRVEIEPGVRLYFDTEGIGPVPDGDGFRDKPIVFGQSFGGMVAQRYIARHPAHPGKVILSSCSPHLGLERKLAVFQRLGGELARAAAEPYWTAQNEANFEANFDAYLTLCLPLYNASPQDGASRCKARFDVQMLDTWNSTELPHLNLLPGLARAACPVLVMGGEEDPVTPITDHQPARHRRRAAAAVGALRSVRTGRARHLARSTRGRHGLAA